MPLKDRNTVRELAEFWGCSVRTVQRRIGSGALACFKSGRIVRITREQVEAFEAANACERAEGAAGLSSMDRDRLSGSELRRRIAGLPLSDAFELGRDVAGRLLVEGRAGGEKTGEAKRKARPPTLARGFSILKDSGRAGLRSR